VQWEKEGRSFHVIDGILALQMNDSTIIARGNKVCDMLYNLTFAISTTSTNITCAFNAAEQQSLPTWETWHRQFGHVSYKGIKKLLDLNLVDNLHINTNSPWPDCIPCTEAKLSQLPFGVITPCITKPGELTHVDLWGKYPVQSINGNLYYLVMVDDASRFTTVNFIKTKAQAADKIKNDIVYLTARG
jgi:GAG-pre-integrase domain